MVYQILMSMSQICSYKNIDILCYLPLFTLGDLHIYQVKK
jgi:hypothetical protein